jgi:hypothetical protein
MGKWIKAAMAAAAWMPATAWAQYETLVNPPDPAAQLAEMLSLYEPICLAAFPDDAAAERRALALGAAPMAPQRVRALLHDDPGRGWVFSGRTARFELTIEAAPFHACAVRTLTANAFPNVAAYRALAQRYTVTHGAFRRVGPIEQTSAGLHIAAFGDQADLGGGRTDALMVLMTRPDEAHRRAGQTAIEVRFAHQLYAPH